MAIFRIHKSSDYTTINNYLIKDKNLNLKDKGMLLVLLSLPDNWDFSVNGLEKICNEAKNTINGILHHLEENGYLERRRIYNKNIIVDWQYDIYEIPKLLYLKNEDIKFEDIKNVDIKNCTQLNTNILNTNKLNKKEIYKEKYGEFKNVLLTEEEFNKLEQANLLPYIEKLSSYMESKGKKYKSHYATILNWTRRDKKEENLPEWFNKDVEKEKISKQEQNQMEDLLKEFK